jgi:hypothetical protein
MSPRSDLRKALRGVKRGEQVAAEIAAPYIGAAGN